MANNQPTEHGNGKISSSINLSLTDELRAFVDANLGDGKLYTTPREFMRDLKKTKWEKPNGSGLFDVVFGEANPFSAAGTHR